MKDIDKIFNKLIVLFKKQGIENRNLDANDIDFALMEGDLGVRVDMNGTYLGKPTENDYWQIAVNMENSINTLEGLKDYVKKHGKFEVIDYLYTEHS